MFAKEEPQAAFSVFSSSISKRWLFIQRTVEGISNLFEPLEAAIRHKLIPAIVGREISESERKILSLPFRYGGLGILDPTETAEFEYNASKLLSEQLTELIFNQEMDITKIDKDREKLVQKT